MPAKRDPRIDIIKGLGIACVVLGHTQMFLAGFVNLFHVGLFFIASGYCCKETYSDTVSNVWTFLKKRVRQLYLPFVLWNLIFLCFHNLFYLLHIYSDDSALQASYPLVGPLSLSGTLELVKGILSLQAAEQVAGAAWFVRALFFWKCCSFWQIFC